VNLNIAHISPQSREQSSSFVQSHLNGIKGNVIHYHGGQFPTEVENQKLPRLNWIEKVQFKIFNKIKGCNITQFQLFKSLKKNNTDLVFVEYGTIASSVYASVRAMKIPLIVHFHGFDAHHIPTLKKYKVKYDSFLMDRPNIIVVSQLMKQLVLSWGVPEKNILYTPCGCDPKFVQAEIPSERKGFLTVGNFVSKKGPLITIKAFAKALEFGMTEKLTMIGDGPLWEECKNWVSSQNLENQIIFKGKLDHNEIFEWMKKSRVFLQHSITLEDGNKEGTPVSILEASGMQMPIISTTHAGINDVVIQNKTGILVEEGDINAMAMAIKKLHDDMALSHEMGINGRQLVAENYTSQHHLDKINNWIEKIITS